MKRILSALFLALISTTLLAQNCSIKFKVTDAEDGSILDDAEIMEDGNTIKKTINGEALLGGRSCAVSKFKICKSGYQTVANYSAEAREVPVEHTVKLINLTRLQANIFKKLESEEATGIINIKEISEWSRKLINGYKDSDDKENLKSCKERMKLEVAELVDKKLITRKEGRDIF